MFPPPLAWNTTGVPQHGGGGGRSSSCLAGSFLIQFAVQVHGNRHGRDLGVARGKSTPTSVPPQHKFGSQPIAPIPSAHKEEELGVPREEGSVATLG